MLLLLLKIALVLATSFVGLYFIGTWNYDTYKKRKLPYVKPMPFVGNIGPFIMRQKSMAEILTTLYKKLKSHRVAGYFEFLNPITLVMDPELIRLITIKDFDHFTDHKFPIREDSDPLFGKNMFMLQGERWKEIRNTLSPAFTSSKIKSMFLLVRDTGEQLVNHINKEIQASNEDTLVVEMKRLFTRYATDVIASTAFGFQCNSLDDPCEEFYKVGREVTDFEGRIGLIVSGYFFSTRLMKLLNIPVVARKNADYFRQLVHGNMAARERENIVRPDMIHLLMQAKKGTLKHDVTDEATQAAAENGDKKKSGSQLSDDEMTAQALVFFLAGFDTASTLLCFMSHLLAVHPDIQARAQQEVDTVLRENGGKFTYEAMQKMTYLDMIINETLRLYPPVVFSERECTKPYTIEASDSNPTVHFKKGEAVLIPVSGIHLDPDYFPDPMKFDPERFSEENKHNIKPFTYLPFGAGPRICIGMRFAMMEAKVAFTSLLSNFDLVVVSRTTVPVVLSRKTFTLNAKDGFWLGIQPRSSKTA